MPPPVNEIDEFWSTFSTRLKSEINYHLNDESIPSLNLAILSDLKLKLNGLQKFATDSAGFLPLYAHAI